MVCGVKSCRQVKQLQNRNATIIQGVKEELEVNYDMQQGVFGAMALLVG